ncbi:MAG: rhombosortase [Bacteroidetes bacterium HGW-Bacteroidetes-21]|jgi:membrane associated rhomboid family serine protease|nr:MAG: rhombosortase [Bacteroidetes bacterium HGW-Bacteroidetes-21]
MVFPTLFLLLLWLVKLIEITLDFDFSSLGIYPLRFSSLIGIFASPLLHGSLDHLMANSATLWILFVALFYFYSPVAFKVFFFVYVATGLWVWVGGRPGFHIGASGIIYGLAAFLSVSGMIRNHIRFMALSLIVIFLYGGLLWGILPGQVGISWESHLLGGVAGIVMAFYYRKKELSIPIPLFPDYSKMEDDDGGLPWQQTMEELNQEENE